ncbi:MAG: VOC family protein [bacterium]|nr:VOC family protein [bacterium]
MNVEHIAFVVEDPNAVADWYCQNMGMRVVRKGGPPTYMTFLADEDGGTMFEIYAQDVELPDYGAIDPLILHFAYYAEDVEGTRDKLVAASATVVQEPFETDAGDTLCMLRDPWGLAVQLVHRKEPMA